MATIAPPGRGFSGHLSYSLLFIPMKLLISNDDGIFALGIKTLADTLAIAGHEVIVVCPDRERSATGHGLTLHDPIRAEEVTGIFHSSIRAWSCSGTPADCVKLALGALLDKFPDFVLSGINQGANLGTDVLYSGTVSAAMEGTIEGIPSIAFSLTSFSCQEFQPAANFKCKYSTSSSGGNCGCENYTTRDSAIF